MGATQDGRDQAAAGGQDGGQAVGGRAPGEAAAGGRVPGKLLRLMLLLEAGLMEIRLLLEAIIFAIFTSSVLKVPPPLHGASHGAWQSLSLRPGGVCGTLSHAE